MNKITAADLPTLLDRYKGIELLSIDCFDTLLWRITSAPRDVFQIAAQSTAWSVHNLTAEKRRIAEGEARRLNYSVDGTYEVTLREIIGTALGELPTSDAVTACQEAELQVERTVGLLFKPMLKLIEDAIARGIAVSISSDTYYISAVLRGLLIDCGFPKDLEVIFNSSADWGVSKASGMLELIAAELKVPREKVLHIGDNPESDVNGAVRSGIAGLLFDPIHPAIRSREKAAESCLQNYEPTVRDGQTPVFNTRKFAFAQQTMKFDTAESIVGYSVVGPLVHAFAYSIENALIEAGVEYQVAFLMRDGHLPQLAYQYIEERTGFPRTVSELEISRFVAIAASFYERDDIEAYLSRIPPQARLVVAARQLMLEGVWDASPENERSLEHFKALVRAHADDVLAASFGYRARLVAYLKTKLKPGVPVMLVDLGYEGTVERRLRRTFVENGWNVRSHYLIATPVIGKYSDRRTAVIGGEHDDDRLSNMLMSYVAPLEIWCSSGVGSVIDYTSAGEPIRKDDAVHPKQRDSALRVQEAAKQFFKDSWRRDELMSVKEVRQTVIGRLGLIEFWQGPEEIELLRRMRLDVNLGTDWSLPIVDLERAGQQLRRRGLFYFDARQERSMCFGAELRVYGIELSQTLAMFKRYGMQLAHKDLSMRSAQVEIRFGSKPMARGGVPAYATHDGFYAIDIPSSTHEIDEVYFGIGGYVFVQLECALLIPISTLGSPDEMRESVPLNMQLHNAEWASPGLVRTLNQYAEVSAPMRPDHLTRLVFRPISPRL